MIISADKKGTVDPPLYDFIKFLSVDVDFIPLTRLPEYQFNEELFKIDKWVLIDYIEYGANDWTQGVTHKWGENTELFKDRFKDNWGEWQKFDNFCKQNPPIVTFKRELLQKDVSSILLPCEYPCKYPVYQVDLRDKYDARPIELMHYWGHSNESRRIFQGNAWLNAVKHDVTICDNIYYLNNFLDEKSRHLWATINIPHFARIELEQVLHFNGQSKLSLSLPGDGIKCFRHAESPINSLMVMMEDNIAWSYPWVHGVNCIKIKNDPIEEIRQALNREDLYDIYLAGVQNLDNYRVENYLNNYIKKEILARL